MSGIFAEEKFRIISTAGCDMTRTTGKMIEAMKDLGEKYELLLIGESEEEMRNWRIGSFSIMD